MRAPLPPRIGLCETQRTKRAGAWALAMLVLTSLGCERRDMDTPDPGVDGSVQAPPPSGPVSSSPSSSPSTSAATNPERTAPLAQAGTRAAAREAHDAPANEAVRLAVLSSGTANGPAGPDTGILLTLTTSWENIHPKGQVEKDRLEGKTDRTGGVGGLARRERQADVEYVEVDVPYRIPKMVDHAYLLVDGWAIALDPSTKDLPEGIPIDRPFEIATQGEVREVALAYRIPKDARDIAFQFFDYQFGSILVPIQGDPGKARGSGAPPGDRLGSVSTELLELAALDLRFQDSYDGSDAGEGRRFAVVTLGGRSLAGNQSQRSIVEVDPTEFLWVTSDGGYLHYGVPGAGADRGILRFTPEVYQKQEAAFLVPASAERLTLGARIQREVVTLDLGRRAPEGTPRARGTYTDGDVMEVLLFGARQEGEYRILDLGIRTMTEGQGLEVRARQQFLLQVGESEIQLDPTMTGSLLHGPPQPFVVPPGADLRFELAYRTSESPTALRVRGFRGEGSLKLD